MLRKTTISVFPVGGSVEITLPYASTELHWEKAAQFMELIRSSVDAAHAVAGDVRLHALSPLLICEASGKGNVTLKLPHPTTKVPWQDASRFVNEIAVAIREAKVDEMKDRPLYDPQRQLALGQIKLRR